MSQLNIVLAGFLLPEQNKLFAEAGLVNFQQFSKHATVTKSSIKYSDIVYQDYLSHHGSSLSMAGQIAAQSGLAHNGNYLLIEPSNLRVNNDELLISDSDVLQLSEDEALEVIACLNQHFNQDGYHIHYVSEHLWLLELNFAVDKIISTPMVDIIGQHIDEYLPKGEDSIKLHKIINEAQMLLHNLELNKIRHADGFIAVNSIWLWDKVVQPLPFSSKFSLLTEFDTKKLQCIITSSESVFLDNAYFAACYGDIYGWLDAIKELDKKFLNLINSLLNEDKELTINLYLLGVDECKVLSNTYWNKYKFWQKKVKFC